MMDAHTSEVAGTVRLIHSDLAASEVALYRRQVMI